MPVAAKNYHVTKAPNVSSVQLGGDKVGFVSENKYHFAHKNVAYQPVDQNRIRDFRSSHFQFGFPTDSQKPISEAREHYTEKPMELTSPIGNQGSNINFNVDGNNYYDTTYTNVFKGEKGPSAEPIIRRGNDDNVIVGMGADPNQYTSEAKAQFNPKGNVGYERARPLKDTGGLDLGKG